jgi:hypothetical protein
MELISSVNCIHLLHEIWTSNVAAEILDLAISGTKLWLEKWDYSPPFHDPQCCIELTTVSSIIITIGKAYYKCVPLGLQHTA